MWKQVRFDFSYSNPCTVEVSNFGRIRTFNKISNGNIINGSLINGYKIIRMKFFKERDPDMQVKLTQLQQLVAMMRKSLKAMEKNGEDPSVVEAHRLQLAKIKKKQLSVIRKDAKDRTIHYHSLIHRLVAEYFLPNNDPAKIVVIHKDYDKLNNYFKNLAWVTPEESYKHQQGSPYVMMDKVTRKEKRKEDMKGTKLSVTKVMLLKKLLNEGKSLRALAKQFKVTDTQIMRIKKGENWAEIQAAP